ncbi:MAG TPA: serine/threonine-protein kinase [Gemmataceae bacterium]|nr:serine/threonine-protein kinase [Gemmataceae bacterium]
MLGRVLLGKYRVSRLLDQGGLCKIWLARQLDPAREVVVKVLQESFAGQAKPREFLRREIHILSRFQHANAVGYYDAAPNDPGGPILVMEYLRGLDLCTLLQREGRLLPERAGRLLVQLCDVLGAAHKAGIVHRDIKPGNVMIVHPCTPQETVKLMDFGLAKMASLLYIGADDLLDFSLPAAAGTPEYIAPEQALGQDIDARGDLYSVGVMLYEMLSGHRPFEHTRPEDLLHAHAQEEPPSFADRGVTHIPAAVEAVVRGCLAKHPDQRPRDAAELLQRYEDALGKRLSVPNRSGVGLLKVRGAPSALPASRAIPRVPSTPMPAVDRHALRQDFEADMPEAMAMLKLKGFLHDLGSEVVESAPGMIRVRLGEPEAPKKKSGLFALLDRGSPKSATVPRSAVTEVELRMARPDLSRPTRLLITLIMRPGDGFITASWRTHSQKIALDLKAYLMGR